MEGIFSLLSIDDDQILNSTLEGLIKIAEINYQYMSQYLPAIQH
jgi:hypothetical protein